MASEREKIASFSFKEQVYKAVRQTEALKSKKTRSYHIYNNESDI